LFFQVPYKNGKQNGWYEQYHDNGAIWAKDLRLTSKPLIVFIESLMMMELCIEKDT